MLVAGQTQCSSCAFRQHEVMMPQKANADRSKELQGVEGDESSQTSHKKIAWLAFAVIDMQFHDCFTCRRRPHTGTAPKPSHLFLDQPLHAPDEPSFPSSRALTDSNKVNCSRMPAEESARAWVDTHALGAPS